MSIFFILTYLSTLLQAQCQFLSRFKNPNVYKPTDDLSLMIDRHDEHQSVDDDRVLHSTFLRNDWDEDNDENDLDPDGNVSIYDFGANSDEWDQYRPTKKWPVPLTYCYSTSYEEPKTVYFDFKEEPWPTITIRRLKTSSPSTTSTHLQRQSTWRDLFPPLRKTIPDRYQLTTPTARNNTSSNKDGRKFQAALDKYLHIKYDNNLSNFTAANRADASLKPARTNKPTNLDDIASIIFGILRETTVPKSPKEPNFFFNKVTTQAMTPASSATTEASIGVASQKTLTLPQLNAPTRSTYIFVAQETVTIPTMKPEDVVDLLYPELATEQTPTSTYSADSDPEVATQNTRIPTFLADSDAEVATQHTSILIYSDNTTGSSVLHGLLKIDIENEKRENETVNATSPLTADTTPGPASASINITTLMTKQDEASDLSHENTTLLFFLFSKNILDRERMPEMASSLKPSLTQISTSNTTPMIFFSTTATVPPTLVPVLSKTLENTTTATPVSPALVLTTASDNITTGSSFTTIPPTIFPTTAKTTTPTPSPILIKTPVNIPTAMTKQVNPGDIKITRHALTRVSTAVSITASILLKMLKNKIVTGKSGAIYPKISVTITHTSLSAKVILKSPKPGRTPDFLYPKSARKPSTGVWRRVKTKHNHCKLRKAKTHKALRNRSDVNDPANWKCFKCGLDETKFGTPLCHMIFERKDQRLGYRRRWFQEKCSGLAYVGGCFKRYLDVGVEYNERGCRTWPPTKGNTYVSKKLMKLEYLLKHVQEGCVTSPHAILVPFSRQVNLYARFHVCVCRGRFCNAASSLTLDDSFLAAVVFSALFCY